MQSRTMENQTVCRLQNCLARRRISVIFRPEIPIFLKRSLLFYMILNTYLLSQNIFRDIRNFGFP